MTGSEGQVVLPLPVAIRLAGALVAETAAGAGVRAVVVKGAVAIDQGLRPPGGAADVDVLAEPGRTDDLIDALVQQGWQPRPDDNTLAIFPEHSLTLFHPHWPCDIDIHRHYPGMDPADPAAVFDRLWDRRVDVDQAHAPVPAPSEDAHAVVIALTALREPWAVRSGQHLDHLRRHVLVSEDARKAFAAEAVALGAAPAVRSLLQELLPGEDWSCVVPPSREWLLYTHSKESATLRLVALGEARGLRRLRMLRDAVAPSRAALASQDLSVAESGAAGLWRVRLRRLSRGVRAVPTVVRDYADFRRQAAQHEEGHR